MHLSHTRIQAEATCPRLAHFKYDLLLRETVKPVPLAVGSAFAHALEHGDPDKGADYLLADHAKQVRRYAGDPWVAVPEQWQLEQNIAIVRGAATGYLATFGPVEANVIREQSYEVPIPGTDWTLVGRADGVIYDAFTGTVDVVEDKLRATKQNVTWIDQQLRFSAWALAQEGTPVRAFRYRQVVKPPRSMRQRKDENWKDWLDRLEREAADPKRMHETLVMPEGKPADTERELRAWVLATEHRLSVGVHPRNTSRCDDFGGCTYRDLCHEQPGAEHAFTTPDQRALEDAP